MISFYTLIIVGVLMTMMMLRLDSQSEITRDVDDVGFLSIICWWWMLDVIPYPTYNYLLYMDTNSFQRHSNSFTIPYSFQLISTLGLFMEIQKALFRWILFRLKIIVIRSFNKFMEICSCFYHLFVTRVENSY